MAGLTHVLHKELTLYAAAVHQSSIEKNNTISMFTFATQFDVGWLITCESKKIDIIKKKRIT